MKKSSWLLTIVGSSLVVAVAAKPITAPSKFVSVEKALKDGAIHLAIHGNGGYSGNCLSMAIANALSDSGYYWLEAGRRLHCNDSTTQDILVTKDVFIPLAAKEEKHFFLFGFCCQKHKHAPSVTSTYTVGSMTNYKLLALAQYLNNFASQHATFKVGVIQQAVWVISDTIPISNITSFSTDTNAGILQEEVAKINTMHTPAKHRRKHRSKEATDNTAYVEYKRNHTVCQFTY